MKTPVELAKERGEEPPKRFSILEASRETRERRRREREAEQAQQNQPYNRWRNQGSPGVAGSSGTGSAGPGALNGPASPANPGGADGSTRWQPQRGNQPNYGSTPPPGWTYPGQPGAGQQSPQPGVGRHAVPTQTQQPAQQHPGMDQYRPGEETTRLPRHGEPLNQSNAPEQPTEEIGFRLPEHERPDHPFEENAKSPDVPEEAPVRDAEDVARPEPRREQPEPPRDDPNA